MKTLAAITNELFKDYIKIVSTDDLEKTLDNPAVPVPFLCVASTENPNADILVGEINKFFEHRKIKNKDFLAINEEDMAQLKFLFNLIQLSNSGVAMPAPVAAPIEVVATPAPTENKVVTPVKEEVVIVAAAPVAVETPKVEVKTEEPAPVVEEVKAVAEVKEEAQVEAVVEVQVEEATQVPVAEEVQTEVVETVVDVQVNSVEEVVEEVAHTPAQEEVKAVVAEIEVNSESEMIEALNIPKGSIINLAKNEEITAILIDEKAAIFEDEELTLVDATRKAFKKAGASGMATGLANWNYKGESLKSLKEKKAQN